MKHRIVHTLQKFLLNPPIKLALAMRLPLPGYALLETKGRKTGKLRRTPVGDGRIGNEFWLVAEHGMKAGYVRNIERDPRVLAIRRFLQPLGPTFVPILDKVPFPALQKQCETEERRN